MKKKISALIIGIIIAVNSYAVFAAEEFGEEVKRAVVAAKSKITVDEDYSEFSYETTEENGQTFYNLKWSNDNYDSYNIAVDSEGSIVYYQTPNAYDYGNYLLLNVRQDEALKNAEGFIRRVIPERAAELKLVGSSSEGEAFSFKFAQQINGIFVMCDDTTVRVSKQNGEILSFYSYGKLFLDKINKKADDLIDSQKAKEAFLENGGVEAAYHTNFDYKTKKAEVFPVYEINKISIDAHNGKAVDSSFNSAQFAAGAGELNSKSTAAYEQEAAADLGLSKSELDEIEKTDAFISSEEAENVIKKYNLLKESIKFSEGALSRSFYNNEEYFWNFVSEESDYHVDFSVDANTGKLNSFSKYQEKSEKAEKTVSQEAAKDKINGYLKLLCPELINNLNYGSDPVYNEYENSYTLRYNRKINNIDVDSNYVLIRIDAETGDMTRFYKIWYNDINISGKQFKLSADEAFDVFAGYADFNLCYAFVRNDKEKTYDRIDAVYTAQKAFNYYIDAESGKRVLYNGEEAEDEKSENSYSDLDGCKYEDEINILFESGFYLNRDKFMPDNGMTKKDFIMLLYSGLESRYYIQRDGDKDFDEAFSEMGIGSADDVMTKNDCAGILIYMTGYEEMADKDEIFADIYSDVDLEHRAEADIAVSLSLLEANGNEFNGDTVITNSEGAHIIYNLISSFWKNKFPY